MRILTNALMALMAMTAIASAADGWQAEMTQEVTMNPEIIAMFGGMMGVAPGDEGMDSPEGAAPGMGADPYGLTEPMITNSKIYFGDGIMRMDMDLGFMNSTTLVDQTNGVTWTFNDFENVAHKFTMPDTAGMGFDPLGTAFMEPTDMILQWQDLIEQYKASEDMVVNELAAKTVNGFECTGISFAMSPEAMEAMAEGVMPGMGGAEGDTEGDDMGMDMFGAMLAPMFASGISGEIWVSEGIEMPVLLSMDMGMMSMSSTLNNIADWTPDPAMLSVPEGYEIVEDDMGFENLMNLMEDPEAPLPSESV